MERVIVLLWSVDGDAEKRGDEGQCTQHNVKVTGKVLHGAASKALGVASVGSLVKWRRRARSGAAHQGSGSGRRLEKKIIKEYKGNWSFSPLLHSFFIFHSEMDISMGGW